ncbi:MAG: hypothetical protein WC047_00380 [Kiritimatiellales bacterium]
MKKHWYLVASLPTLRLGEKPPMDAAAFRAACTGHLSDEETAVVEAVLENREPASGAASNLWNAEVQLRDAVVRVRAKNRGTDAGRFIRPHEGFSVSIEKAVTDAFTRPNPLEQQMELDRARWALADELALTDPFGFAGVLSFAAKVCLAERWAKLDDAAGQAKVEALIEQATSLKNEQEAES